MLRLAVDENLNARIIRGLLRQAPELDVISVQEAGLTGADDPTVLQWAADVGSVLLTHDVSTMTRWAHDRMARGEPMPGLVEVNPRAPIGEVIGDLLLLALAGEPSDIEWRILYVPF